MTSASTHALDPTREADRAALIALHLGSRDLVGEIDARCRHEAMRTASILGIVAAMIGLYDLALIASATLH